MKNIVIIYGYAAIISDILEYQRATLIESHSRVVLIELLNSKQKILRKGNKLTDKDKSNLKSIEIEVMRLQCLQFKSIKPEMQPLDEFVDGFRELRISRLKEGPKIKGSFENQNKTRLCKLAQKLLDGVRVLSLLRPNNIESKDVVKLENMLHSQYRNYGHNQYKRYMTDDYFLRLHKVFADLNYELPNEKEIKEDLHRSRNFYKNLPDFEPRIPNKAFKNLIKKIYSAMAITLLKTKHIERKRLSKVNLPIFFYKANLSLAADIKTVADQVAMLFKYGMDYPQLLEIIIKVLTTKESRNFQSKDCIEKFAKNIYLERIKIKRISVLLYHNGTYHHDPRLRRSGINFKRRRIPQASQLKETMYVSIYEYILIALFKKKPSVMNLGRVIYFIDQIAKQDTYTQLENLRRAQKAITAINL